MMQAIKNGIILLPDGELRGKAVVFDEKIREIVNEDDVGDMPSTDAQGHYIAPGLMDVHTHGYRGADVSDADAEGIRQMARGFLENGVTSFLPTTMTVDWAILETVFGQIRALMKESKNPDSAGAEILGCHAEGPFINPGKKGAQAESAILPPDAGRVLPFQDVIRVITFAPEMPGGDDFIRRIRRESGIALSIGHTGASFDEAVRAIDLGASRITHTFNAMTPLHHRDPGVAGAALTQNVYAELIADTFHVHRGLFPMMHKMKGDHLVLITDSVRATGMPDGEYTLGGQAFTLKGIECRMRDGTIAGSVLKLNQAVKNFRDHGGVPLYTAVRAASLNAAASIGMEKTKGSIEAGKDADLIMMDEDCQVLRAWVSGKEKYRVTAAGQ